MTNYVNVELDLEPKFIEELELIARENELTLSETIEMLIETSLNYVEPED